MQRLLQEARYVQAIAVLSERIDDQPQDRMAQLLFLLANISHYGSDRFAEPIEELRFITDLSTNERNIVRRIFLVCFQQAERDGQTLQKIVYQRLIRRLLLNQPLDLSIGEARAMERCGGELPTIAPTDLAPTSATSVAGPVQALAALARPTQPLNHLALTGTGAMILLLLGFFLFDGQNIAGQRNFQPLNSRTSAEGMAAATANHAAPLEPPASAESRSGLEKAEPALKAHTRRRLEVAREARSAKTAQPTPDQRNLADAKPKPAEPAVQSGTESEIISASTLKQEPRFAAEAIEKVDRGERVIVLDRKLQWIKVKMQTSGNVGYLRQEYLSVFNQLR